MWNKQILKQLNIESWCQKVLDLLDLTFADFVELHGTLRNSDSLQIIIFTPRLSQYLDGNSDKRHFSFQQGRKISGFYGIFQIFPWTQAMLTQKTKKVWTLQPQAKPSHTWGAAWGAAQARCSRAALPSDYITRPVALVQHCSGRGGSTEEQQAACSSSREAEEHLSGMCVA